MRSKHLKHNGFTLIELIIVIAIIAVLAAVIVPGYTRFIEDSRFSNDNQLAVQMTQTLELTMISDPSLTDEDMQAVDIRNLLDEASPEGFDWTPQSRDSGFYYLDDSNEIVIRKHSDMLAEGTQLGNQGDVVLLNGSETSLLGPSPEEIFGEGKFLLSTSGSVVAEVVSRVRELPYATDHVNEYEAIRTLVNDLGGFFNNDDAFKDILTDMLDQFDPEKTLYVSNNAWKYVQTEFYSTFGIQVDYVVFARNIQNIPPYTGPRATVANPVFIPRSVKTIEADAFNLNRLSASVLDIRIPATAGIKAETGAFQTNQQGLDGIETYTIPEIELTVTVAYGVESNTFVYDDVSNPLLELLDSSQASESIDINITSLPRSSIDRVKIDNVSIGNTPYLIVKIYSDQGLIGIRQIEINYVETLS